MSDANTTIPVEYVPCNSPRFDPDKITIRRTESVSGDSRVLAIHIDGPDAGRLSLGGIGFGKDRLSVYISEATHTKGDNQ